MDSTHKYRKRFTRRLAVLLAAGLLGTAAGTAFADATEVGTYEDLYSTLNSTETTEVSQTEAITLGENGLAINGSHSLNINANTLSQGTSSGFTFVTPEGQEDPTTLTITGTGGMLDFTSFTVNEGSDYGYINLSGMTNAFTDAQSISGLTLGLYNTSTAATSADGLAVTSGGLYVESGSSLTFNGALNASNGSTVELNQDYSGAMSVSGLAAVSVNGTTTLNGETISVSGNQLDEETSTQYRSFLSTPKITGKGTIEISEGGLLTSSGTDDLLIQNEGGDLAINITTDAGGYIQPAGALTINAAGEKELKINMTGEGWIQPQTGNLTLSADSGSTLTINAKGVYENGGETVGQAVFTTNADAVVGGDGTINITLNDAASLDSCGNMTIGTGSGTVNINLEAENWGYMQVGIQGEETSKLTIGTDSSNVNLTINTNNSVSGDAGIIAAADAGSTANITLNGGTLMGGSYVSSSQSYVYNDVVLGQAGKATLTGNGSVVAKNLTVGKESGSNAELKTTGSVYAQNMVVAAEEGSTGTVEFGDSSSTFVLYGSEEALESDLTAKGHGSVKLNNLYGTDDSGTLNSYALLDANAQLAAKDVTVTNSLVQMNEGAKINADSASFTGDSYLIMNDGAEINAASASFENIKEMTLAASAKINSDSQMTISGSEIYLTGENSSFSSVNFKNSNIYGYMSSSEGYGLNVNGNLTLDGTSYTMLLNPDGTNESQITVTDGSLTIKNDSELGWGFSGDITSDTEWVIATADKGITGEWKLPDEELTPENESLFRYSQRISDDKKTQYLGLSLNEHFFNIRANSMQLARQSLWSTVDDRISWNSEERAFVGPKSPFYNYDHQYSTWFKAGYRGMNASDRNGYDLNAFNLAVGVDCAFEEYFAAGAFFHYGSPKMEEDHETAKADNYSAGIYAGYKMFGGFELKGMAAYTFSDYEMERNMKDFGTAETNFRGSALTASVELARPFFFNRFVIRPLFAVDTECVWQDEALEEGNYSLIYMKNDDSWTYARVGAKLDLAPSDALVLNVKGFYAHQLGNSDPSVSEARFVSTRDAMDCVGANLGDHYFNAGATLSYMFSDYVTIFGGYNGFFSDESKIHTGNGGIQINF